MARVKGLTDSQGRNLGVRFVCPGCGMNHALYTQHTPAEVIGPRWSFNDNHDRPTLSPSIHARGAFIEGRDEPDDWDNAAVCHSFVTDGRIQFLGDCTHALAGQTVDLPECAP